MILATKIECKFEKKNTKKTQKKTKFGFRERFFNWSWRVRH